jgi:hypothetical protein
MPVHLPKGIHQQVGLAVERAETQTLQNSRKYVNMIYIYLYNMSTCRFHFSSRYDQGVLQKGQPVATKVKLV